MKDPIDWKNCTFKERKKRKKIKILVEPAISKRAEFSSYTE